MRFRIQHVALSFLFAAIAGCSSTGGDFISATNEKKSDVATVGDQVVKHGATLRIDRYVDQREVTNPRYLGKSTTRISGMTGNELILDRDAADIMTDTMNNRFDANNFRVLEGDDAQKALFEVSGVIKALELNVLDRDEIKITIETTLKEASTGKVVWSGITTEMNNRFAGVSGNDKEDVESYLKKGLRVVSDKTVEAISTSLKASRPELFNLAIGTKPIEGVGVLVAPSVSPLVVPAPASNPTMGQISVSTNPPRARIYLDGVYYGLSPMTAEVEPGFHDVVVKLSGYKNLAEKVSVRKGDNTELELSLEH